MGQLAGCPRPFYRGIYTALDNREMTANTIENSPMTAALLAAVPLRIIAINGRGGPNDSDLARAKSIGQLIAEKGDILQFGGGKKGEAADLFNELAQGIAILSFSPGGVRCFGQHWCGNAPGMGGSCPGYDQADCCQLGQGEGDDATLE